MILRWLSYIAAAVITAGLLVGPAPASHVRQLSVQEVKSSLDKASSLREKGFFLVDGRARARSLGLPLGAYPAGKLNAITDVPGVKVGHTTLIKGDGALVPGQGPVRTGVTVVIPRDDVWHKKVPAGSFVLNGTGE